MNKRPILDVKLVSIGQIVSRLHYGVNSREWWIMRGDSSNLENGTLLYPIRVGWQTVVEQNNRHFYMEMKVVKYCQGILGAILAVNLVILKQH